MYNDWIPIYNACTTRPYTHVLFLLGVIIVYSCRCSAACTVYTIRARLEKTDEEVGRAGHPAV